MTVQPPYRHIAASAQTRRDSLGIAIVENAALGGRHVRVVALPAALRVFDVSGERVVGVITDQLDVEYVVVYVVPGGR